MPWVHCIPLSFLVVWRVLRTLCSVYSGSLFKSGGNSIQNDGLTYFTFRSCLNSILLISFC